jgi:hypothetical protein
MALVALFKIGPLHKRKPSPKPKRSGIWVITNSHLKSLGCIRAEIVMFVEIKADQVHFFVPLKVG